MFTLLKAKNVLEKLESFIQQHQLFQLSDQLALAVSGGKDSVFAAHALNELGYSFKLVHCNFKLRGEESDQDQDFVEQLAAELSNCNGFITKSFNTSKIVENQRSSIQAVARQLRYAFFQELYDKGEFDYLITAHHKDDVIETFMINLYRVSGLKGLSGIPMSRDFYRRPLLDIRAEDIKQYVVDHGIVYREDRSNSDNKYLRNQFRNEILPQVSKTLPDFAERVSRSISILLQEEKLLDHFIAELEDSCVMKQADNSHTIDIERVVTYPHAAVILYRILEKYAFNIDQCRQILNSRHSGSEFHSATHRALLSRNILKLEEIKDQLVPEQVVISEPGSYNFGEYEISLLEHELSEVDFQQPDTYYLDLNTLSFPLILRTWQSGDKIKPLGLDGHKLVSDIFIDLKIDTWQKELLPILEHKGEIIWIDGYRIAESAKITDSSTTILRIESRKT